MVSGSADNTLRLWAVATGKCLFTWEFPTAVKRVTFSDDDKQIVCITEQRMGYQSTIRVFNINRKDDEATKREHFFFSWFLPQMEIDEKHYCFSDVSFFFLIDPPRFEWFSRACINPG
jgi:WD40 repeat protein